MSGNIMGSGDFAYKAQDGWAKWPEGWDSGDVAAVGVDRHDNVYAFNRGPHPMVVFDRAGNFLRSWGEGIFKKSVEITNKNLTTSSLNYSLKDVAPIITEVIHKKHNCGVHGIEFNNQLKMEKE